MYCDSRQWKRLPAAHPQAVVCCDWSPDGRLIATAGGLGKKVRKLALRCGRVTVRDIGLGLEWRFRV